MPTSASYDILSVFSRMAEGDHSAFKEIFNAYWSQVYGTTLRLTKSPEQAKDLAQDIFMRVWENREKMKGVQNPQSYIYILSRNLVLNHLHKKVFNPSNIDFLISYFQDDAVSPQEKMELGELETTLRQAVETLPGKVKDVFRLSRYEGLTHEQIANKLGISVVSSKTYTVRALRQIRRYLASQPDKIELMAVFLIVSYQ